MLSQDSGFRPVARLADLPVGAMTGIDLDGSRILLVRSSDGVKAMSGTCPHAGGPLAEGVLEGDRVFCPWHKAAFRIGDCRCVEPPAVDDLRPIPVEIRDGTIFLSLDADEAPSPEKHLLPDGRCFAVIGGGAAGAMAAQTLRAEGFAGRVVLIDREGALPYDRTILSKYTLSGAEAGEKTPLQDEGFYPRHAIERLTGDVAEIHAAHSRITFADGTTLTYHAALIATGGVPKAPGFAGGDLPNVFLLRSARDAEAIAAAAGKARRAVIIGAGFIGMEAAASLRERGLDIVVIAEDSVPFETQLGPEIGGALLRLHEAKGVRFRLGSRVAHIEGETRAEHVVLTDGESIAADFVVIGLGIRPATGFQTDLALAEDGAVVVDAGLRAAEGIYAAGDIARFPLRGDGPPIRVEHWRVAQQQGRIAARNMLGADLRYDAVPFFWTTHYMKRLDYVGHASGTDPIVPRGDIGALDFIAYYLRDGHVIAAAGMGRDRDMAAILALLAHPRRWTVDDLHPADASPADVLARLNRAAPKGMPVPPQPRGSGRV